MWSSALMLSSLKVWSIRPFNTASFKVIKPDFPNYEKKYVLENNTEQFWRLLYRYNFDLRVFLSLMYLKPCWDFILLILS